MLVSCGMVKAGFTAGISTRFPRRWPLPLCPYRQRRSADCGARLGSTRRLTRRTRTPSGPGLAILSARSNAYLLAGIQCLGECRREQPVQPPELDGRVIAHWPTEAPPSLATHA